MTTLDALGTQRSIRTRNIDKLASRRVTFATTYCQTPIYGPSRASVYTGRYMSSHGSGPNFAPPRVGWRNIGHHLNALGARPVLVSKSQDVPDLECMERLGIDPASPVGRHLAQGGFEEFERDDGIHPDTMVKPGLPYNAYLKSKGHAQASNPWHRAANSVETGEGVRSGFSMIAWIVLRALQRKILKRSV